MVTSPEYFPHRQLCPLSSPLPFLIQVTPKIALPTPSPPLLLRHSTAEEVGVHASQKLCALAIAVKSQTSLLSDLVFLTTA